MPSTDTAGFRLPPGLPPGRFVSPDMPGLWRPLLLPPGVPTRTTSPVSGDWVAHYGPDHPRTRAAAGAAR